MVELLLNWPFDIGQYPLAELGSTIHESFFWLLTLLWSSLTEVILFLVVVYNLV